MLRYLLISLLLCNVCLAATQQEATTKRETALTELTMAGENSSMAFLMWMDTLSYAAQVESDINGGNWENPEDKQSALNQLDNIVAYLVECWSPDYSGGNATLADAQTSYNDSTGAYNAQDWTGAYVFASDVATPATTASNVFTNLYILANQKNSRLYDLWLTIP